MTKSYYDYTRFGSSTYDDMMDSLFPWTNNPLGYDMTDGWGGDLHPWESTNTEDDYVGTYIKTISQPEEQEKKSCIEWLTKVSGSSEYNSWEDT